MAGATSTRTAELLTAAQQHYDRAMAAQRAGDWAAYGKEIAELGKALARRGHQVHFISTETPFRLGEFQAGLSFHQVLTPTYPLFREPQYLLSLSNKIVQVAREFSLDVIHAHYAVPHATAGFLHGGVLDCGKH